MSRYNNTNNAGANGGTAPPARKGWRTIASLRGTPAPPSPSPTIDERVGAGVATDFNSKAKLTDAEYEAALAQQQSAYGPADAEKPPVSATVTPPLSVIGVAPMPASRLAPSRPTSIISKSATVSAKPSYNNVNKSSSSSKPLTVKRSGGGKTWEDTSLLEWDPTHFRLFVGNLSGEVTDEILERAFQAFSSLSKVKVVTDSRTHMTKGYGFVSFKDPEDYFKAFKSMNNKYIGNHPVQLRKATTDVKPMTVSSNNKRKQGGGRNSNDKKLRGKHQNNQGQTHLRSTPYDKLA